MDDIPNIVRHRLRDLIQDTTSLQAPNFASEDLVYHEPQRDQHEPMTGVWSMNDAVFGFSLVGQVSAHHTFLGEYGDLVHTVALAACLDTHFAQLSFADPTHIAFNALLRAKWKVTLALPNTTDGTPEGAALQRQAEVLQQIEDQSCLASPLKGGTVKGASFVYRSRDRVRASVYSENIYRHALVLRNEEIEASKWSDSRQIFRAMVDERKATLAVRPLDLYTTAGDPIPMADAAANLSPGTWVELRCTLRMWDNSSVPTRRTRTGDYERRANVRSFQIGFDSAQVLCAGRLTERPRTTMPSRPAVKRPFCSLALADGAQRPMKRVKEYIIRDAPMQYMCLSLHLIPVRTISMSAEPKDERRYVLYPISLPGIWDLYKRLQQEFWTVEEVLLTPNNSDEIATGSNVKAAAFLLDFASALHTSRSAEVLGAHRRATEVDCFVGLQIVKVQFHLEALATLLDPNTMDGGDHAASICPIGTAEIIEAWLRESQQLETIRIAAAMLCYSASCEMLLALPDLASTLRAVMKKILSDAKLFAQFAIAINAWVSQVTPEETAQDLSLAAAECAQFLKELVDVDITPFIHMQHISDALSGLTGVNIQTPRKVVRGAKFTTSDTF
ncbi:hypothetical protein AURDEDRAFT_161783 [Auricularia subglabra TFB-10046 SS5]|nr:hypothetical protein AURDEDRAFT_161783 [Auricularia subglabra TFB-10046 SS5]